MLLSISLMILIGFALGSLFKKFQLPALIGFMLAGIVLGPYGLDMLDEMLLAISGDLRQVALVIILLRAGLSLDLNDLKAIGKPAIWMAFIPSVLEIIGFLIIGPWLFGFSVLTSLILGSILAAVSPAVIVPRMLHLIQEHPNQKSIPQLIMAGASLDDIFVIVIFTGAVQLAQSGTVDFLTVIYLPIALSLGIFVGMASGLLLIRGFKYFHIRDTSKVLILLSFALFFVTMESELSTWVPFSGLLATLSMGITVLMKYAELAERLVIKYEKIWVFAELWLFVLVGALINLSLIGTMGLVVILGLFIGLIFRSIGVWISTYKYPLSSQVFMIISYLPKATVQASIGAIPFALGLPNGEKILIISALAIIVTAPLGAFLIDHTQSKLLHLSNQP